MVFVCLSVCLSLCPSVCLPVVLSVCEPNYAKSLQAILWNLVGLSNILLWKELGYILGSIRFEMVKWQHFSTFMMAAPSGELAENKLLIHSHSADGACVLRVMSCGGVRSTDCL